jgi:2'-5' RNA ligase
VAEVFAVVSLLRGEARDAVLAVWELLERRFGLRAAQEASHPHLTYVIGAGGELPTLARCVGEAAAITPPAPIIIDGMGVFPGASPVLFLRVVRTRAVAQLYGHALEAARCAGTELWPNYEPARWAPHITLALRDMRPEHVPAALEALRERQTRLRAAAENLCVVQVRRPLADSEYVGVYPLGGQAAA